MVVSEKGTDEEEALVRRAGEEVNKFVKNRWVESEWETAWFVNPPVRPGSVPSFDRLLNILAETTKCSGPRTYPCLR